MKNNITKTGETKNSAVIAEEYSTLEEIENESIVSEEAELSEDITAGNVKLKAIVTEKLLIPDGKYVGVIIEAFCYNYAEEKVMLKIEISDGTVFVNPVTLDQLARYPYSKLVSQINATELEELKGVRVDFEVKSRPNSEFSYVKRIALAS